jgi:hypothetical protein
MSEEKKKTGRPKKPKTEPTFAEKRKGEIAKIEEANAQLGVVAQKFVENPQPFFEEREKEIAETIAKYGNLQNEDLENGIMSKKDYALQLTERLMNPLYSKYGSSIPKHTALSLQLTNEFYWEKVVLPLTETSDFIPNIYDYFSLLGISKKTFDNYQQNSTEDMRETCEMILDKFIGYYQRKGMKKECDTIMAMFTLKTTFRQRENDAPQVVVANINTTAQERIDKYARQYGFDTWNGGNE